MRVLALSHFSPGHGYGYNNGCDRKGPDYYVYCSSFTRTAKGLYGYARYRRHFARCCYQSRRKSQAYAAKSRNRRPYSRRTGSQRNGYGYPAVVPLLRRSRGQRREFISQIPWIRRLSPAPWQKFCQKAFAYHCLPMSPTIAYTYCCWTGIYGSADTRHGHTLPSPDEKRLYDVTIYTHKQSQTQHVKRWTHNRFTCPCQQT